MNLSTLRKEIRKRNLIPRGKLYISLEHSYTSPFSSISRSNTRKIAIVQARLVHVSLFFHIAPRRSSLVSPSWPFNFHRAIPKDACHSKRTIGQKPNPSNMQQRRTKSNGVVVLLVLISLESLNNIAAPRLETNFHRSGRSPLSKPFRLLDFPERGKETRFETDSDREEAESCND